LLAVLLTLLISSVVLPATGAYRKDFEWAVMRRMRRLIAGWAIVLLMLISIAAALKATDYYSRIWFGTWTLISTTGLIVVMLISHAVAISKRNRDRQVHPIVLVGTGNAALQVENRILNDPSSDMTIAARFGEESSDEAVNPISELAAYVASHPVHAIWIAVSWDDKRTLDVSLHALRESAVDVNVVPDLEQYRLLNQRISEWGGLPVISLAGTPMTGAERRLKNMFDWLGALVLIVLLSPLLLLLSVLIKVTSAGPVFFRQKRHGVGGESIEIFKFRSMKLHREEHAQVTQASQDDERVTAIGRLLRKSSLDELPQLINVLKGEMSLVGPRPHAMEHNEIYKSRIPKYMLRHKVKPGVTGWAQVNGFRGQTEAKEKMALRIEHDLWYIQNWSLSLDLKILLITPFVMIHRNAY
jgi:putative colanic acid biosynthesis UDP-glucose lipid carrier transferase